MTNIRNKYFKKKNELKTFKIFCIKLNKRKDSPVMSPKDVNNDPSNYKFLLKQQQQLLFKNEKLKSKKTNKKNKKNKSNINSNKFKDENENASFEFFNISYQNITGKVKQRCIQNYIK